MHIVGEGPRGPWARQGVFAPPFAHEPDVVRGPKGEWVMTCAPPLPHWHLRPPPAPCALEHYRRLSCLGRLPISLAACSGVPYPRFPDRHLIYNSMGSPCQKYDGLQTKSTTILVLLCVPPLQPRH